MIEEMYKKLGISPEFIELERVIEAKIKPYFENVTRILRFNQMKVLKAFQESRVGEDDFNSKTGYGFSDIGREKLECIYSSVFNTEDAIVRPIIVSGTHALSLSLTGLLFPEDEMIAITGRPYDTLEEVIGLRGDYPGSLLNIGVKYKEIDLTDDGSLRTNEILKTINDDTKLIYVQRSSGYSWRKAITIRDIEYIIGEIKSRFPQVIVMVDNCYGEFLDKKEPTDVGADIMAGSLIKNPGGGIATGGGYIVGKKDLIELIAMKMTAPGIGKEQGLMFNQTRLMMQGFFMAPKVVSEAIKGAIFCSAFYDHFNYEVSPAFDESRSDIIQSIKLGSNEAVISFCQGVQNSAPIDSYVHLEPWDMPGYSSQVIMAAGAFVQGSSIELSADAPIREPYIAYFQGGLTYEHSKIGVLKSASNLMKEGLLNEKDRS